MVTLRSVTDKSQAGSCDALPLLPTPHLGVLMHKLCGRVRPVDDVEF